MTFGRIEVTWFGVVFVGLCFITAGMSSWSQAGKGEDNAKPKKQ